jgi:hypothetical protein
MSVLVTLFLAIAAWKITDAIGQGTRARAERKERERRERRERQEEERRLSPRSYEDQLQWVTALQKLKKENPGM